MKNMEEKWSKFNTIRIIDGKPRKVIVDICGNIINNSPTDEELKQIKRHPDTGCREISKLQEEERKIYLLEFIRYFYYKEGRVPEVKNFNGNPKYPSFNIYINIFKTWKNAIREAGLKPRSQGGSTSFTDEELLRYLIQFFEENGKSPTKGDFNCNQKYPNFGTYQNRFGSWTNALKIVGLDVDSMIIYNIIETTQQKGRLGELFILETFEQIGSIDLSGQNCNSHYDGVCPHGYNYDVKTSGLHTDYWKFDFTNICINKIEWFYLIAFDRDYTTVVYVWRVPKSKFIEDAKKDFIDVGPKKMYDIENMRQYDITEKVIPIFKKWKNSIRKWTKEEIVAKAKDKLQEYVDTEGKTTIQYDKRHYDRCDNYEDEIIVRFK